MPLQRFAAVMRARWLTAVLVWLATVAAAVLATFPGAQYKAVGMVLVEPKTVDPAAGLALPGILPNHIPTEIDVAQSERVALRALRAIGLEKDEHWRSRWNEETGGRGDFEAWVAERILSKYDVRPSRESNVLTLAFRSDDAAFSAKVVNALMQAYIDISSELRTEPARQSNTVFDETAKRLRAELEQAHHKLSQFEQKNGLVMANDERMDVENVRLIELSSQVVALQAAAAAAAGRERQGNLQPENMQEVLRDPMVTALATDLARQEGRLAELASRLGERHPTVIELRNSINDLRARTARATKRASDSIGSERKVAEERLANARTALQTQRATVLRMKAQRDEAMVLQREVENAQRAYDAALTRSSQTAMESRGPRPNVSVLKVATAPVLPWLKPWLIVVAASVIGLLLGIALALFREMRDRRLRSLEDVVEQLQQPVLAVLRRSSPALAAPAQQLLLLNRS